jgi:hypothetical protein
MIHIITITTYITAKEMYIVNTGLSEDLTYRLDIILDKSKINKEAYYNIIRTLNITTKKYAINLLNFIINHSQENLDEIADELDKLYETDEL